MFYVLGRPDSVWFLDAGNYGHLKKKYKALGALVQIWQRSEEAAAGFSLDAESFQIVGSEFQTAAKSTILKLETCPFPW